MMFRKETKMKATFKDPRSGAKLYVNPVGPQKVQVHWLFMDGRERLSVFHIDEFSLLVSATLAEWWEVANCDCEAQVHYPRA